MLISSALMRCGECKRTWSICRASASSLISSAKVHRLSELPNIITLKRREFSLNQQREIPPAPPQAWQSQTEMSVDLSCIVKNHSKQRIILQFPVSNDFFFVLLQLLLRHGMLVRPVSYPFWETDNLAVRNTLIIRALQ